MSLILKAEPEGQRFVVASPSRAVTKHRPPDGALPERGHLARSMSASQQRTGLFDSGSICKPVAAWKAALRLIAAQLGRKTRALRIGLQFTLVLLALTGVRLSGAEKAFTLSGVSLTLEDVSSEVEVRYRSMRLNRALNVWNVEVTLTNKGGRVFRGPFVLSIDSFAGTTGPQQTEGIDDSTPAKPFYDLSNWVPGGTLAPGTNSLSRTLSLGVTNGSPSLTTKVYAKVAGGYALGLTRSLNDVGQPLPGVQVVETGPQTITTNQTDGAYGVVTLAGAAGSYIWRFDRPNYLPVWRKQNISRGEVQLVPNPRLVRQGTNTIEVGATGGLIQDVAGKVRISVPSGALNESAVAVVTVVDGQTLPGFLPQGWSPLSAFWFELSRPLGQPASATLQLSESLATGTATVLARWNETSAQWEVAQLIGASGSSVAGVNMPGPGAYALVIGDTGPLAPPAAQPGQALAGSLAGTPDLNTLSATGIVNPRSSPPSLIAEEVTAIASVNIQASNGPAPSGLILRCEVQESYQLKDGSRRFTPQYETFVTAHRQADDTNLNTLHAQFPMRPLLLFGPEELARATVKVDVVTPGPFTGGVFEPTNSVVAVEGVQVIAEDGDFTRQQAAMIRRIEVSDFESLLAGSGLPSTAAFDLTVASAEAGRSLGLQISNLPPNRLFVLGRVVSGHNGLEPVERLRTDTNGVLSSMEPASAERLPGITGSGQYALIEVAGPQALIRGTARNSAGQPAGGLPVRLENLPWLTLSEANGAFRLIAPTGTVTLVVRDLATGDTGRVPLEISDPSTPVAPVVSIAPLGPYVLSITPSNGAKLVARVTPIVIQFSEAINPGTLGANGIQLVGTNGQPIEASLTLKLRNTIATLLPTTQLPASTAHTVVLSTNIADLTGLKLEGLNSFTFTTDTDALDRIQTAQVISHEPTNGVAVMVGSPGIAEPEAPVILVNETTGRSATILSKPDGSFTNSIEAGVDDFLSAVIVNKNGTRNTIPVSRQLFRDGSVGLFSGGGVLEAQSDGGPVQVFVEPGAIETKTKFKLESLTFAQVLEAVKNTQPETGRILGGFRMNAQGDDLQQSADVAFPVQVADLQLPPGVRPEEASYALTVAQEIEGETVYEIVDNMDYENGKLVTHTFPFLGLLGFAGPVLVMPLMISTSGRITVSGKVQAAYINFVGGREEIAGTPIVLPGAFIALNRNIVFEGGRPGRLRPGAMFARSDSAGKYAISLAVNRFVEKPPPISVVATHPRFFGKSAAKTFGLEGALDDFFASGNYETDLIFNLGNINIGPPDHASPVISVTHTPYLPGTNGVATVKALATDNTAVPTLLGGVESVRSLVAGVAVTTADVSFEQVREEPAGALGVRKTYEVTCPKTAEVKLAFRASDNLGNPVFTNFHSIQFGGSDVVITNPPPSDPNDDVGPMVIYSTPADGSKGHAPGQPIVLAIDAPLSRAALQDPVWIEINPPASPPALELSADGRALSLMYSDLQPGKTYTVSIDSRLVDVSGNRFDQDPATAEGDTYNLRFTTATNITGNLPGVIQGGGAVLQGIHGYVLERGGEGSVLVYDLSNPTEPEKIGHIGVPGYPRDLCVIPNYSFKRRPDAPTETKNLLAVVGGHQQGSVGQYLWIIDISDPAAPKRLTSTLITAPGVEAATKIRWDAPLLVYLVFGDVDTINEVNLQEFIVGTHLTREEYALLPRFRTPGIDLNQDGDYVDAGEGLPLPPSVPPGYAGLQNVISNPETSQGIIDFVTMRGGEFIGAVLDTGQVIAPDGTLTNEHVNPSYRTLYAGGLNLSDWRASSFFLTNAAKRVFGLPGVPLVSGQNVTPTDLVFVSLPGRNPSEPHKVIVLDVTDPLALRQLGEVPIDASHGVVNSIEIRDGRFLVLATSLDLLLIDLERITANFPNTNAVPFHPALAGIIPGAGTGARSFGSTSYGLNLASLGTLNRVVLGPPHIEIVSFPTNAVFQPATWVDLPQEELQNRLAAAELEGHLVPARFKSSVGTTSTLSPPHPSTHYYVLLDAPGSGGATIPLLLESLDRGGRPLNGKGPLFPPPRAASPSTAEQLGESACSLPTRSLTAWRLSSDPASPFYNKYLSLPFAVTYESMTRSQIDALYTELNRAILWSGNFVRASIDPGLEANSVLTPFAATYNPNQNNLQPGVSCVVRSLPAEYIMGPNPSALRGAVSMPDTLGFVSAHNGEFNATMSDMFIPGRRLPIDFQRSVSGQGVYEGPFGVGWDFNYNQRLVELTDDMFPAGNKMPLVERGQESDSEVAQTRDVLWYNGTGRTLLYKYAGDETPPEEFANDPLIQELGWLRKIQRFYLPTNGVFNLLAKFKDGSYASLEPDGSQYWFGTDGRLQRIYDRYLGNVLKLSYNKRGELRKIENDAKRNLQIGYWHWNTDPDFEAGLDSSTSLPFVAGKICRIKDDMGRDILYYYTDDGFLERREGPNITFAPPGGFTGRQITTFVNGRCTGTDRPAESVYGIVAGEETGNPLFVSTRVDDGDRPSIAEGNTALGRVQIQLEHDNTAAAISAGLGKTIVRGVDGVITTYALDALGRPKSTRIDNGGGEIYETQFANNADGMVTNIVYPEGNSVQYLYDSRSRFFRSRGNLIGITKSPGLRAGGTRVASAIFDPRYNLETEKTDFNTNRFQITLTDNGRNPSRITLMGGESETLTYNEYGQLTEHLALGNVTRRYTYTDTVVSSKAIGSLVTRFEYEGNPGSLGLPTRITDPRGIATEYRYDERNQVIEELRGQLALKRSYDQFGNLVRSSTSVDGGELIEEFVYDQAGFRKEHVIRDVETGGSVTNLVTTYEPDSAGRVRRVRYPSGEIHELQHDNSGRLLSYKVGDFVQTYTYDKNGNVLTRSVGDAVTTHVYDGYDRLIESRGAEGAILSLTYDFNDNLLIQELRSATNSERLFVKTFKVDAHNRVVEAKEASDAGESTVITTFNASGRYVEVKDALGAVSRHYFDDAGRVVKIENPHFTLLNSLDGNGNVTNVVVMEHDGEAHSQEFAYGELDFLIQRKDALGHITRIVPDIRGSIRQKIDSAGRTNFYTYTRLGELASTTNPEGVHTFYAYNANRQLDSIVDGASNVTRFVYDNSGRLVRSVQPDGTESISRDFDARNAPTTEVLPGGTTVSYTLDKEARILTRNISGPRGQHNETYTYDVLGRVRSIEYPGATVGYEYDKLGYTKRFLYQHNGYSHELTQSADAGGFRSSISYPSGVTVLNRRDNTGRLLALTPQGEDSVIANTVYEGSDKIVSRQIGTNIQVAVEYDVAHRVTGIQYSRSSDAQRLAEVRYAYDGRSSRIARQYLHRAGRTDFFTHDGARRLLRADLDARPSIAAEAPRIFPGFAPTIAGNWSPGKYARTMGYNAVDALESCELINPDNFQTAPFASDFGPVDELIFTPRIDGVDRTRDEVGNLTRGRLWVRTPGSIEPVPEMATFRYDAFARLTRIERDDGVTISYRYGTGGLMIRRTVTGDPALCVPADTDFVYDGGNLIETKDIQENRLLARYYYGDDSDELLSADFATGTNQLSRYYFLFDALRSVMALADSTGKVTERVKYDIWGEPSIELPDLSPPQLKRIVYSQGDLLFEFTETVLPALPTGLATSNLVDQARDISNLLRIENLNGPVDGLTIYEENLPGFKFGGTVRFRPSSQIPGALNVRVSGGILADDWNNLNPEQSLSVTNQQIEGQLLYVSAEPTEEARIIARSSVGSPFLFHGQYYDYDAGLIYMRARFYDPATGLFLQKDPLGYDSGVNHYAGFANDPINLRDPTGRFDVCSAISGEGCSELGNAWKQSADSNLRSGSLGGLVSYPLWMFAGSILDLGTGFAQGLELAGEPRKGPRGAADLIRAGGLILSDVGIAATAAFGGSWGAVTLNRVAAPRLKAYTLSGSQYLRHKLAQATGVRTGVGILNELGVTAADAISHRNVMRRHNVIFQFRVGNDGIKNQNVANLVRNNVTRKGLRTKEKIPQKGSSYFGETRITGDLDGFEVYDAKTGKPVHANLKNRILKEVNDEYRHLTGRDNVPYQHPVHMDSANRPNTRSSSLVPDSDGSFYSVHLDEYAQRSIGHSGHTVTINLDGKGNIRAWRTPGWSVDWQFTKAHLGLMKRYLKGEDVPFGLPSTMLSWPEE